jgi:2-keto-4-pentenoate hydratase/2-oxohepta-3-ene-1,7-dioic acid hydratase in catechol pathway
MKGDIIFNGTPKGIGSLQTKDKVEIGFGNKTLKTITVSSVK